jgi:hypothetical protein
VALFLIAGIVSAVVMDVVWGPSGGEAAWTTAAAGQPYRGQLTLDQVKYDPLRRMVTADVSISITGSMPDTTIGDAVFRMGKNSEGDIDLLPSSGCTLLEEGEVQDGGRILPFKRFACGTVPLGHPTGPGERAYPFDGYAVRLAPSGCVDENECLESKINLAFHTVTARAAHPALLPVLQDDGGLALVLARRPFIKHLALVLAVMATMFFALLTRVGEPRDLFAKSLGFYGTLWALRTLLVPATVSAFPTYVDYFVLTLFGLVFAVMLHRLSLVEGVIQ